MDKLRKALSGQEAEEEERGFVAQVGQVENIKEFLISFSSHKCFILTKAKFSPKYP